MNYLKKLEQYHYDYFVIENNLKPTLYLDGNENVFDEDVRDKWIRQMNSLITSTASVNIDLRNNIKQMRSMLNEDYEPIVDEWDEGRHYATHEL
jgi:hypothetical protein